MLTRGVRAFVGMGIAALLAAACQNAAVVPAPAQREQVIKVSLKRFEFMPNVIRVKQGVPVVLELTALDRTHGFLLRSFGIDEDVRKGKLTVVKFVPDKLGTFEFHCDNFCGDFHDDMTGTLIVEA